ncbi:aldehyde dehydrogenase [Corallococcus exercitus]|uniref:Aldehyde dehydrogenase n=1 Tax=Corallococcus exercitus TaxID=2316736 RepID=A0A3A8I3R9_9BACT|nr:aldehyde dehydrogenase [Corallococcus exercitus]NOK35482.1 aldehyde dehydrogenase [Corallococcus exercitus]RKG77396.1 aldehyde dehydrogenase [Corallococcus exercitus]
MTTPESSRVSQKLNELRLPYKLGARTRFSHSTTVLQGIGDLRLHISEAPRLAQVQMVERSRQAFEHLRKLPDDEWLALLREVGRLLDEESLPIGDMPVDPETHVDLVTRITGVPSVRVRSALKSVVTDLQRMETLLSTQSPDGMPSVFRTGRSGQGGHAWTLAPQGQQLSVRVPANSPAINITWLIAFALRRPILLAASAWEPFTPLRLLEAIYRAGAPDGAASLAFGDFLPFMEMTDQVLWAGDVPEQLLSRGRRLKTYHQGRSKAVVVGELSPERVDALTRMAISGAGRLCTNVSGLLVVGDAERAGLQLAESLGRIPILPLSHPHAVVPAFPNPAVARAIDAEIRAAEARGAIDLSARCTGQERLVTVDGVSYLRPTVLLVDGDDRFFGAELPFPFVTVARAREDEVRIRCRNSLIVSTFNAGPELVRQLAHEPSVDKVFQDDFASRGYDSTDPHEGFMSEFLFFKKAIWPPPTEV